MKGWLEKFQRGFVAAAFAEADCHEAAMEMLRTGGKAPSFLEAVGLRNVRVRYGLVPVEEDSFVNAVGLAGVRVRTFTMSL